MFDSGSDATEEGVDAPNEAGPSNRAKVIVVHASPDVAAVRVCFAIGIQNDGSDGVMAPIAPLPKNPLAPGAGAVLPDLGLDLSPHAVTPYVVLASKITSSSATCDTLAGNGGSLVSGLDYFKLETIPTGTFSTDTTLLITAMGCLPSVLDPLADKATCGSTYDTAAGNLTRRIDKLDRVVGNTQRFGAQLAHVSSPASGVWGALYGATNVSAALHAFDGGGADEIIVDQTSFPSLAPSSAASLAMPNVDQTALVVAAVNADGGAAPTWLSVPLPLIHEVTTGQATGENTYFVAGANYTFVFLGDPRVPTTLDGGVFNGYALHALAFPNDPTVPAN
jgi:hypothetical protein